MDGLPRRRPRPCRAPAEPRGSARISLRLHYKVKPIGTSFPGLNLPAPFIRPQLLAAGDEAALEMFFGTSRAIDVQKVWPWRMSPVLGLDMGLWGLVGWVGLGAPWAGSGHRPLWLRGLGAGVGHWNGRGPSVQGFGGRLGWC